MSAPLLSARLPRATRDLHAEAERAGVMRRLLAGRVGVAEYARLLGSLHAIYAALERALADERVRAIAPMPALRRTDALARDLADFGASVAPDPLAIDYASHIARLAREDPALVCAHAYVRYLGDLSGGQVLRGIVRRALALGDDRGVSFYALGDKAAVERTKAAIRAALDALPAHRHDDVVAEARGAFARHVALFEALEAA